MKRALYPGSFDPFTVAHEQIVAKALTIFDEVVIGIGYNVNKNGFLSIDERERIIEQLYNSNKNVKVVRYNNLTVDLCRELDINHIVRGVRSFADFEFESKISDINSMLMPEITTLYLTTEAKYSAISSSAVRELIMFGADVSKFLPEGVVIRKENLNN